MALVTDDYVGIPFVPGGRARDGFDCYGLLLAVLQDLGHRPPDPFVGHAPMSYRDPGFVSDCWADATDAWEPVMVPSEPGDALVMAGKYHPKGHVAVYLDRGRVLHTAPSSGVVCLPWARVSRHVKAVLRLADHYRGTA